MTLRSIAVQGIGSPPLAVATQGFRGAITILPGVVIWIRQEVQRFAWAGAVRRIEVPDFVRAILIPQDPAIPGPSFSGSLLIMAEPTDIRVLDDPRLVLMPEEA